MITDSPLAGYENWQVMEVKKVASGSAAASFTFDKLQSDIEEIYKLEFFATFVTGGSSRALIMKPNNVATNQAASVIYRGSGALGSAATETADMRIIQTQTDATIYGMGTVLIYSPKSGMTGYQADFNSYGAGQNMGSYGGYWNQTTQITSLVLAMIDSGTFYGTFILSKLKLK